MAELTVQKCSAAGLSKSTSAAATGGDTYVNGPQTICEVENAGGGAVTVTAARSRTAVTKINFGEIAISDIALNVPATTGSVMFKAPLGSHSAGGIVSLTYSGVTSVTVRAIEVVRD